MRSKMGNWSKQQKEEEEKKEREKIRKEKLAGFFYNVALATFSGLVIGGILSAYQNAEITPLAVYVLLGGSAFSVIFAILGNNKLK